MFSNRYFYNIASICVNIRSKMSVTYRAYEYDEDQMSNEYLRSAGVRGAVGQLSSNMSVEEELEIEQRVDQQKIGENVYEIPQKINSLFSGLTLVTPEVLEVVESIIEQNDSSEMRTDPTDFSEWLADREGEQVFVLAI